MKHGCRLLFVTLIFSVSPAYSQYLEAKDIDIFIGGFPVMNEALSASRTDRAWESYIEEVNLFSIGVNIFLDGETAGGGGIENTRKLWQAFMDCKVPKELNGAFRAIGWRTSGHQKFWSILFISVFTAMEPGTKDQGAAKTKALTLFNNGDVRLVKPRLEEIVQAISGG